jgi:hypothetical protein
MAKTHEFHEKFSQLPATGFRARELGETLYFTGKRCLKGHLSPRYASSGNCSQCIADIRGNVEIKHKGRSSKRSYENHILALEAHNSGHLHYDSIDSCPFGHYKRFITSNNCVECSKNAMQVRSKNAKWSRVLKLYGLLQQDVELMLKNQNSECVICCNNIVNCYHIDHCHATGKVRGLLCQKCNQAIGLLQENENLFLKASQYIKKHNAKIT